MTMDQGNRESKKSLGISRNIGEAIFKEFNMVQELDMVLWMNSTVHQETWILRKEWMRKQTYDKGSEKGTADARGNRHAWRDKPKN